MITSSHLLVYIVILFVLFITLNEVIKHISRKDREQPPPIKVRLWLIPTLSILVLVPIAGFTFLYGLFFYAFDKVSHLVEFTHLGDLITFSLVVMLGFLLFQTIVHPILVALITFGIRRKISVYAQHAITIIADSILIYVIANLFSEIYIKDYISALSIAVFYHIIQWVMAGLYLLYKRIQGKSTK